MDINCGAIVTARTRSRLRVSESSKTSSRPSGKKTSSEIYDYGDNEFVPWQVGAIT